MGNGQPLLVVVTGPSATGKTTLSRRLASDLRLPLVSRDDIKERLFDTLGWHDRAWSQRLGAASYELLYATLDLLLQTGHHCLVESNFSADRAAPQLVGLVERRGYRVAQINCRSDPAVLIERFKRRVAHGERHPGHVDHLEAEELRQDVVQGFAPPLALGGELIDLDTTSLTNDHYQQLAAHIRALLEWVR